MEKDKWIKDRGIGFILIALAALVLVSIGTAFKFFIAERMIYKTYADMENRLKAENSKLAEEISKLNQERDNLKDKFTLAERELKRLEQEVTSIKIKYESLVQERENLIAKADALVQAKTVLEEKVKDMESDEFVASLIREKASLNVEIKNLKAEIESKRDLSERFAEMEKIKSEAEKLLKNEQEAMQALSHDFLKEREEKTFAAENLEKMKVEKESFQRKLEEAIEFQKNLESKLMKANDELSKIKEERDKFAQSISEANRILQDKSAKIEQVKKVFENASNASVKSEGPESVELPPIIVKVNEPNRKHPSSSTLKREKLSKDKTGKLSSGSMQTESSETGGGGIAEAKATIKGRVVTVNYDYNFVVIDLGKENGLNTGMRLSVYRGDDEIGEIEVKDPRDRIAACDIKRVIDKFQFKPDDTVLYYGEASF